MAKRKRIGLFFSYDERWIAGTYYILNIIHALKTLDKEALPVIVIITEDKKAFHNVLEETKYPFLEYQDYPLKFPDYSFWERAINAITLRLFNKKVIRKTKQPRIDFLYPNEVEGVNLKEITKVNWIPDLQELYLPHLFSEKEINGRKSFYENTVLKGDVAVFSSEDSKKDFEKLYPNTDVKLEVLPFAVTHPDFTSLSVVNLLKEYCLPHDYFFVPNQFWAHKNHMIVLEAIHLLKQQGAIIHVAFSGKELDFRNQDYVNKLKEFVATNKIEDQVHFLGFLDRKIQLCLMKHSKAIIQPSLFEGWSTVVEDAKSLSAPIILSNIPVHKEQCAKNVTFFNPKNSTELAGLLKEYMVEIPAIEVINYEDNIKAFGLKFNNLIANYS